MKMTMMMPGWSAHGGQTLSPYVGKMEENEKLLGHSVRQNTLIYSIFSSADELDRPQVAHQPAPQSQSQLVSLLSPWGQRQSAPSSHHPHALLYTRLSPQLEFKIQQGCTA